MGQLIDNQQDNISNMSGASGQSFISVFTAVTGRFWSFLPNTDITITDIKVTSYDGTIVNQSRADLVGKTIVASTGIFIVANSPAFTVKCYISSIQISAGDGMAYCG